MNLDNYTITRTGKDAFEKDYEWTVIAFETSPDKFMWWNPPNYRIDLDPYIEGLPPNYDNIKEIIEDGCSRSDLAKQVGAIRAWGLDL